MIHTTRATTALALLAVGTLSFQLEFDGLVRLAPTDLLVVLALVLGATSVRYRPGSIIVAAVMFPVAMTAMLAPALANGHFPTSHTLVVKLGGAVILAASYLLWQHVFCDEALVRRAVKWFIVGGMAISLIGLLTWMGLSYPLSERLFVERSRFVGGLADPNNFGALMASVLVFAIVGFPYPFHSRTAASATVGLATLFVALSSSRGAWIAVAIGLPLSMYVSGRLRPKHFVFVALAGALTVVSGLVSTASSEFEGRPDNLGDRLNQFDIGVAEALRSPLTGLGLGEFQLFHDGIIHNSVVWLWVEGGLIGLTLFACFALAPIRHVLRSATIASVDERRLLYALFGAHLCMLIVSMGIEATYQRYWWFYLAILTSVVAQIRARSLDVDAPASMSVVPGPESTGR